MKTQLAEEVKFWGPDYGKIYPQLEDATPYKKLMQAVREGIGEGVVGKWLDVGCGSGAMIELIWQASDEKIEEIVAFDLTETMLEHARRKVNKVIPANEQYKIKLMQHDLSYKLPFADNYFDGIVANLVLPYVINHEGVQGEAALRAVLGEMNRVLKPGGKFVWSTPVKNVNFWMVFFASWREILNPMDLKKIYYGPAVLSHALKIQKKGQAALYSFLDKKDIDKVLDGAGFKNHKIKLSFAGQAHVITSLK